MTRIFLDVTVLLSLLCRTKSLTNFSNLTTAAPPVTKVLVPSTLSFTRKGTLKVSSNYSTTVLQPTKTTAGPFTPFKVSSPFPITASDGTEIPENSPCRKYYNETFLEQSDVEIAYIHMHKIFPLWYTYCSASLLPLMCSIYLPKYDPETKTKFQGPCTDLCDQVASDCSYAATKLNFPISVLLNKNYTYYEGSTRNSTNCFRLTEKSEELELSACVDRPCCFEVKPQPFCNFPNQTTVFNDTMQNKIVFKLSTYLPLFHALDSLNLSYCAKQLSSYLCVKHYRYCSRSDECPAKVYNASRQQCLSFFNISSPCSLSRIDTTLKNAGYNIEILQTDFDCSTLPSKSEYPVEIFTPRYSFPPPSITDGGNIPRLSNFSILRLDSSSVNINWKMNGDRNKINEYVILWRKSPENPVNETKWYYHILTTVDHYTFNNMDSNVQYEVLVAAVSRSLVPEPFTLIVIPKSPDSIFKGFCPREIIGTPEAYGIFDWPETPVGNRSIIPCPHNCKSFASRDCWLTNQTENGTIWGPIDVTKCEYKETRSKQLFLLVQKEVNVRNVVETSEEVKNLSSVNPGQTLSSGDIANIATILEKIVSVKQKANEVSEDFLTTIDNVLDAGENNVFESQRTSNSSSRTVTALNNLAENLVISPSNKFEKVKRNYAISLQSVPSQNFLGLSFSGTVQLKSRKSQLKNNSIATNFSDNVPSGSTASISIPRTILNESTILQNTSRQQTVIFALYKETKFFRVSFDDTAKTSRRLNSVVIAGSIKGKAVVNLSDPVKLALKSVAPGDTNSTLCSYWNFHLGNWSQEGCSFQGVLTDGRILCYCNHLTNFAMLMDINPSVPTKHDSILGVISYVGCALSLIGLILTIITILILRELRRKIPSQILLNFCIALSLSLIVFLAAVERSKTSSLARCRTAAITLHYFLLSTFFWMGTEAFNMYLAFIKVFPISNPSKFMLKCCLFAWGLPVLIVVVTMIVALDKYGDETYCRLHGVPFIVAFFTPVTVIIVGNIVAFCFIIRSLLTSGSKVTCSVQKASGFQQARQGIAIMVLLGLTWLFGILAVNDAKIAFQYLFCIFNTLQGLFVFILFCILPTTIRKQLLGLLRKKSPRQESERNVAFNNSNDTMSTRNNTSKQTFQSLSSDNPVEEAPLDSLPVESENLQKATLNPKISDELFLNPDVTRYSIRKNGPNYVTTVEINLQPRYDLRASPFYIK